VALLVGREVHVADLVEELHAHLPFVDGQLDLAGKLVDMFEQGGEDLAASRGCAGPGCVYDGRRECRIELGFVHDYR
jgi:hypothetical protein